LGTIGTSTSAERQRKIWSPSRVIAASNYSIPWLIIQSLFMTLSSKIRTHSCMSAP
jgi:hypothetical protein